MSEPTTSNPANAGDVTSLEAAYSSTFGTVRRKPDIDTRIVAEEIRLLIDLGKSSSYPIIIGILITGGAFWGVAPLWVTGVVLAIQTIAQLYFNHVRAGFRADANAVITAPIWARRYAIGTFLSGLTWGVGGLLWLQDASFAHHVFYALVLAAISAATAISRATYIPAVLTYIGTAVPPTVFMFLRNPDLLSLATVGLAIMFLMTLVGWARRIARAYRDAIRLRFENADLVERMARAHAATEQKRCDAEAAEQRAKAANRLKGEFLDILGGEVSAPLDTLVGMTRQFHDEPMSDQQRNLADAMLQSSERLQSLFREMIDFSQMEAQTLELKPQQFDPVEFVRSIMREMRPQATARGLSLELDIVPGSVTTIRADPDRLRQVLTNLISNAIKFTERGGVILRVQLVEQPDGQSTYRFSVIDTGIGLTTDARANLFEGFAKGHMIAPGHHTTARAASRNAGQRGGMGLGLAVSDRLVRLMGGQIEVDSAIDQGSTFWFLLPREYSGTRPVPLNQNAATARPADRAGGGTRIRYIDHDFLYEKERELGPDVGADLMVEALITILSLYEKIEAARRAGDISALKTHTQSLHRAASASGLIAIANAARTLHEVGDAVAADEVPRLHRIIAETWDKLARTYPGIIMNNPDS
jgi:signal transduction histidine kinase